MAVVVVVDFEDDSGVHCTPLIPPPDKHVNRQDYTNANNINSLNRLRLLLPPHPQPPSRASD